MKRKTTFWILCVLALLFLANDVVAQTQPQEFTYAIEINDVLCGYADVQRSTVQSEDGEYTLLKQHMFLMLSALGFELNREIDIIYHLDPATGWFRYADMKVSTDDTELRSRATIDGNVAHCIPLLGDNEVTVDLPDGVTLENSLHFPHLIRDFVEKGAETKSYLVLAVETAAIQRLTYTKVGMEQVKLAARNDLALCLDQLNEVTGGKARFWLDTEQGLLLKMEQGSGQTVYLAEPSIRKKIELANLDQTIATKTNVSIGNVEGISYLKVKARIEPTGRWLAAEDLNIPGQRFEGTVEKNVIDGIFEIEHPHYDGAGAPAYPPSFEDDSSLQEYLEPGALIQSDDAVLVEKAQQIAAGSKDSWEAACRLSQWVADNINYEIPGGLSARGAYNIRAGECGAHSLLLAAFCRAVRIPARVVWGATYTRTFGGAFGQHAWSEIYMGEAGWIPVDSTGYEAGFVDSGHIRLGVFKSSYISLNAKSMEILDYRVGFGATREAGGEVAETYAPFVGEYARAGVAAPVRVFVQDGRLTVEVKGSAVLPLNDPDENGFWAFHLSDKLRFTFEKDEEGKVVQMYLHQTHRMRRRSEPEEIGKDVPEPLRRYLGGYLLAGMPGEFMVLCRDGKLTLREPTNNSIVPLRPADEEGTWISTFTGNRISFDTDDDGKVNMLILDTRETMRRLIPAGG